MRRATRRRFLAAGAAGTAAVAAGVAIGLGDEDEPARPGWRQVFFDDFTGADLDPRAWGRYDGPGTAGVGWRAPEQVTVVDGRLRLAGIGDVGGGLRHRRDLLYGRWEVRARMERGAGFGPTILLWPGSGEWPEDGEIDIAEVPRAERRTSHFTVHWGADNRTASNAVDADFTQWHVFGCEWWEDRVRALLDGRPTWELRAPREAIPRTPMHLAIQLDPGAPGTWIGPRDAATPPVVTMEVDWVRVAQHSDMAGVGLRSELASG